MQSIKKYNNIYGIYPCLVTQMESYSDILIKMLIMNNILN